MTNMTEEEITAHYEEAFIRVQKSPEYSALAWRIMEELPDPFRYKDAMPFYANITVALLTLLSFNTFKEKVFWSMHGDELLRHVCYTLRESFKTYPLDDPENFQVGERVD